MKILHCADIHFRNDLVSEIRRCSDFMVNQAREENVNLSIIAGDIFDERLLYDTIAVKFAIEFVKKLAEVSPVYILKGTNSHDGSSLKFLDSIRTKNPLQVVEQIGITGFLNEFVSIEYDKLIKALGTGNFYQNLLIFGIPPVSKANVLAFSDNDMEGSRLDSIDTMRNVLQVFGTVSEAAKSQGIPTILVGHLTVTGSMLSTGQQMVGREVELGVGDLRMSGSSLTCLGHIHRMQHWGEIYYSGSVTRLNFGEEEDKGFWIHELEGHKLVSSRFVNTPAREMITVDLNDESAAAALAEIPKGAHVRVRLKTSEEDVHKFDEVGLREKLLGSGAADVKVEKTVIPVERTRAEGISQLNTIEDKLKKWAETVNIEITPEILVKLHELDQTEEMEKEYQVT